MNYISEINAFYNVFLPQNPISGNAQALWHRLMAYCNAFGWADDFTISNMRLADDISISRQELDRLRNILIQKGLLTYKKGNGNQCGSYKLNSVATIFASHIVTQSGYKSGTNPIQSGQDTLPLNKPDETKPKENKPNQTSLPHEPVSEPIGERENKASKRLELLETYQSYWCEMLGINNKDDIPKQAYTLMLRATVYDIELDLMKRVINMAVEKDSPTAWFAKVITNLIDDGITTCEQYTKRYGNNKQSESGGSFDTDEFYELAVKRTYEEMP